MNNSSHNSIDDDDQELAEWLRPLQAIDLSPESRSAIRQAVTAKLAGAASTIGAPHNIRWWRRSIAVPVPVAAMTTMILASLSLLAFRQAGTSETRPMSAAPEREAIRNPPAGPGALPLPVFEAPHEELREDQFYVCGLGRISFHSTIVIRD